MAQFVEQFLTQINFSEPYFPYAVFFAFFNPFIWNFVARIEYNTKFFSKISGDKYVAAYIFSAFIFTVGIIRDVVWVYYCTVLSCYMTVV